MAKSDWYYTVTASWTTRALDQHPNRYFNGYEKIGDRFGSEDAARTALAPHLEREEIGSGMIFCQRDVRGGQIELRWRKSVDKPGHVDTPFEAMLRAATTNADGTDWMDPQ